jgi:hypothetical protein
MNPVGRAYIGTSGYTYKSWDKTFYGETPRKRQLEFYAGHFPTLMEMVGRHAVQPGAAAELGSSRPRRRSRSSSLAAK